MLNKSWRQHPTKYQLYGHLPPITKIIQVRRTRHAGHWRSRHEIGRLCRRWRSRDELISDVLQWTPTYGRAKAGRPARTYIQQLCEDTGCRLEDLPEAINDREKWRERVKDIRASGTTWWWCLSYSLIFCEGWTESFDSCGMFSILPVTSSVFPARTYIQQLCADTDEDLPGAMDDRDAWQERVRKILAGGVT